MGAKRSASDRPTEMEKARRPMFQQELEELKGGGPPDRTAVAEFIHEKVIHSCLSQFVCLLECSWWNSSVANFFKSSYF